MPVPTEQARYRRFRPAVRVARATARDVAHRGGLSSLADELESVVGELVANAVVHGRAAKGSQVLVTYRLADEGIRVEVRDWATGTPRMRQLADSGDATAEGGRGLAMVSALSIRWGVNQRVIGKTVWCELGAQRRTPDA